jgi:hypothetical protein
MRDVILGLLRAGGRIRRFDAATTASVRSFFAQHLDARLESEGRRHPLGFLVVSQPLDEGVVLRYHLWPSGWAPRLEQESGQTHDHSYELNSVIVAGSLRQRTFRAALDITGTHDVLEVEYRPEGSALRRSGLRARLIEEVDETFGEGTAYRLPPGTVHRVDAVGRPAATLVLAIPASTPSAPRVFVPSGEQAPGEFIRDRFDAAELLAARETIARIFGE